MSTKNVDQALVQAVIQHIISADLPESTQTENGEHQFVYRPARGLRISFSTKQAETPLVGGPFRAALTDEELMEICDSAEEIHQGKLRAALEESLLAA